MVWFAEIQEIVWLQICSEQKTWFKMISFSSSGSSSALITSWGTIITTDVANNAITFNGLFWRLRWFKPGSIHRPWDRHIWQDCHTQGKSKLASSRSSSGTVRRRNTGIGFSIKHILGNENDWFETSFKHFHLKMVAGCGSAWHRHPHLTQWATHSHLGSYWIKLLARFWPDQSKP